MFTGHETADKQPLALRARGAQGIRNPGLIQCPADDRGYFGVTLQFTAVKQRRIEDAVPLECRFQQTGRVGDRKECGLIQFNGDL